MVQNNFLTSLLFSWKRNHIKYSSKQFVDSEFKIGETKNTAMYFWVKLSDEFGIGSNWHLNLPDRHIYVYLSDSYVIEKGHFQFCHALLTFRLDMIFFCHQIWQHFPQHKLVCHLKWSTCPLVFGSGLLNHVLYLKLRNKYFFAKLSKFTKWRLVSLKMALGCLFKQKK